MLLKGRGWGLLLKGGRGVFKGQGVCCSRGGGEVLFCLSSCVFLVGLHVVLGRSLALRGGNLKNKKVGGGLGGRVHIFNNPLPLPFATTPSPSLLQ